MMLSFDVSAIDVVLAAAVVILLGLQLPKKSGSSKPQPISATEIATGAKNSPKPATKKGSKSETLVSGPVSEDCMHGFGYLQRLPKNSQIPDGCFGCGKVMRCLFKEE